MSATYRITTITKPITVELVNESELLERFAPHFTNTADLTIAKQAKAWVAGFLDSAVFQSGHGVAVERVSPEEIFNTHLETFAAKAKEAKSAKEELQKAGASILRELTEEEVAAAPVRTIGKSDTTHDEVTYFVKQGSLNLAQLLEDPSMPSHVLTALEAIKAERSEAAAKRIAATQA